MSERVYEFTVSIGINAPPARIWRALCDPAEVVRWDSGVTAALDAPPDYPRPGQHVRWRSRGGLFRILHDRPQEVIEERRLRSRLTLSPYRYDETYTLEPLEAGCRLSAHLIVSTALPVVGRLIERAYLGRATRRDLEASLESIKRLCESSQAQTNQP